MEQRFLFAPSFPTWFIVAFGIFTLILALFSYLWVKRKLPLEWKVGLLSLRLLAIVFLILPLMRPAIEIKEKFIEKAQLVFLLDQSESMSFRDELDGPSRAKTANQIFDQQQSLLRILEQEYEVKIYDIRNQLQQNQEGFVLRPEGFSSPLTRSVRSVLLETSRKRSQGLIFVSDGQDTYLEDLASVSPLFKTKKIPVYGVGVGEPQITTGLMDIGALEIKAPLTTFEENTFVLEASFHFLACAREFIELEFFVDDQRVQTLSYRPNMGSERKIFKILHTLPKKGLYKLTLKANPLKSELSLTNNTLETFIEILSGEIKVLYLEGQSRSEFKFLSRAFEQAREIQMKSILWMKSTEKRTEIPQTLDAWMNYDVIIVGDLPKDRFSSTQLDDLKKAVETGGRGFLMIGGLQNYGPGGYANSPIADILPVTISDKEDQFFGFFRPELTTEGQEHFVLRLDPELNTSITLWQNFPELDGYNKVSGVKPTASVLLKVKDDPLLVYYPYGYGKGRSMAFLADTTWRWSLNQKETSLYFKKFWRQMVLWLARRDQLNQDKVWIQLDERRFPQYQSVPILVMAEKTSGDPSPGVAKLEIRTPSGKVEVLHSDVNTNGFSFPYRPTEVGVYTLNAEVTYQEKKLGTSETKIVVFQPNQEIEHPQTDFASLKQLSHESGGRFYPIHQFQSLLEELKTKPSAVLIEKVVLRDIWDNWIYFLFVLILLSAEWTLRKWKSLA